MSQHLVSWVYEIKSHFLFYLVALLDPGFIADGKFAKTETVKLFKMT